VRDEDELEQKFNYILGNPWRRWPSLDRYSWECATMKYPSRYSIRRTGEHGQIAVKVIGDPGHELMVVKDLKE
jgi:hypothetical protein